MASLVTAARYRVVTLDTTSTDATVTAALEAAQTKVEEFLRRPLASAERTETVRFSGDRRLYPLVTPVTAVDGGLTIVPGGSAIYGASPDDGPFWPSLVDSTYPAAAITYTAGYDADTLPETIAEAICWAAYRRLHATTLATVPAGASSASVGDVSVSFGPGGAASGMVLSDAERDELRPWRRRFV